MRFSERISRISVSTIATVLQKAEKLKARMRSWRTSAPASRISPRRTTSSRPPSARIEENFTKYTATGGIRELRQALVEHHAEDLTGRTTRPRSAW